MRGLPFALLPFVPLRGKAGTKRSSGARRSRAAKWRAGCAGGEFGGGGAPASSSRQVLHRYLKVSGATRQEVDAILDYNRQRIKTPFQIGQEMRARRWAETKEAKGRQGQRNDINIRENFPECRARDKVGGLFGVSGRTVEKQVAVVEKIYKAASSWRQWR